MDEHQVERQNLRHRVQNMDEQQIQRQNNSRSFKQIRQE